MRTFKTTVGDKEVEILIKKPSSIDVAEADKIYAKTVADLLTSDGNYMLASQLEKYLREKNIWTDEDDKEVISLEAKIAEAEKKLSKGGISLSEGRKIAISMTDYRLAIMDKMSKRQALDDITIEALSKEERFDYLIYSCTINNLENKNYWETFESLKEDKLSSVYVKARENLLSLIFDVSTQIEKSLPENKWLAKYGFVNDNLELIHPKTKQPMDRSGNVIKPKVTENFTIDNPESNFIDDYETV